MNTEEDVCPDCGSGRNYTGSTNFDCGTVEGEGYRTRLCLALEENGFLKKEMGQITDEPNPNGSLYARLNYQKDHYNCVSSRFQLVSEQLDLVKEDLKNALDNGKKIALALRDEKLKNEKKGGAQ
jgi:hypothetical protein